MPTLIFGHKNPDTDSVVSAIALSYLRNKMGYQTKPFILGDINRETKYVLEYFNTEVPEILDNVKIQLKDMELDFVKGFSLDSSITQVFNMFKNTEIKTIPLIDLNNHLIGIVTMKDIAVGLMNEETHHLNTRLTHIANSLGGKLLTSKDMDIKGRITVLAYNSQKCLDEFSEVVIVGNNSQLIEEAINSKVKLIIITGNEDIPSSYIELAEKNNVALIKVNKDTYTTVKLVNHSNYISTILVDNEIIQFNEDDYLSEVKEEMINTKHRNYPVVNQKGEFIGFVNKKEIINPHKKKVILVDHNETSQSASGIDEAEIVEIVDHHKIGDIVTEGPINFRNIPLGSTCTIVYQMMKESNVDIPYNIAGLLISGIISDTLLLKSPTTTIDDHIAVEGLNYILDINTKEYSMNMFKEGSSLEGYSVEEVFNRDFKEFIIEGYKIGVSQIFTLDINSVMDRKDEFTNYIKKIHLDKNYYLTIMLITDIEKNGSYLLYQTNNINLISLAFGIKPIIGTFASDIVSRKKQVIPKIAAALRSSK
ncbi:MAG: putative manganese-dependent inorganic diphosphatase [Vulcanibacillus sp.]